MRRKGGGGELTFSDRHCAVSFNLYNSLEGTYYHACFDNRTFRSCDIKEVIQGHTLISTDITRNYYDLNT